MYDGQFWGSSLLALSVSNGTCHQFVYARLHTTLLHLRLWPHNNICSTYDHQTIISSLQWGITFPSENGTWNKWWLKGGERGWRLNFRGHSISTAPETNIPWGNGEIPSIPRKGVHDIMCNLSLQSIYTIFICTGPCAGGPRWDQRALKQFGVFSTLASRLQRSARFRYSILLLDYNFGNFVFFFSKLAIPGPQLTFLRGWSHFDTDALHLTDLLQKMRKWSCFVTDAGPQLTILRKWWQTVNIS